MPRIIDPQAAEREGLQEVNCGRCGAVLAHQTRDKQELIPNDKTRTTSRVGLYCGCGGLTEWRRGRGTQTRKKSALSAES